MTTNTNVNSLQPASYNPIKCKPKNGEVLYPIAYNDYCNMENNLDTFLTQSKYNIKKSLEPALSLHTLPKLYSSKKLLAYNEYCDISQNITTSAIPYAYNDYCNPQTKLISPLVTYISPTAIIRPNQTI
jgi:hypothetical protein